MIDLSLIGAASSALSAARDIGKAAMGLRDFNAVATTISQLNEQIIRAQDALFSHQSQLLALHQELGEAKEKLRVAEKMLEDRGNYELFRLSDGVHVYRLKTNPGIVSATRTNEVHYLCQPCFDAGRKAVLVRVESMLDITHCCPLCKTHYLERHLAPSAC